MLRSIVVPLDGSRFSELALPFAQRLAAGGQLGGAELHTFHAAEGPAGNAILEEIRVRQADLVVMATHGRGGPGRALFGSTADHVLRHAEVPVLLVPARCSHHWPSDRPVRIAVTLDGSDFSESVLGPLRQVIHALERGSGAELLLVRIVDVGAAMIQLASGQRVTFDAAEELLGADRYLDGLAAGLRTVTPRIRTLSEIGSPHTLISELARDSGADLIAMATHGRGGLTRLVLGSVATSTLRHAGVPVFLSRPTPASLRVEESALRPSTSRLLAVT